MLAKSNWAALFILTYTKEPLKASNWRKILDKFAPELEFDTINVYSESIANIDNDDGTFTIANGNWKGRHSNGMPYIEVIKANYRKRNHKPISVTDLEQIKTKLKTLRESVAPNVKIDHIGTDYFPYKDPFKIDKGKPKNPSLPINWGPWAVGIGVVIGGMFAFGKNKKTI